MSQVSYGTITITDTTDLTTYIRYAKQAPLTAASQFQETPTTETHYIAVLSIPSSDTIPAWNSTDWKWSEFIGTDGVSVLGTREIYYLKTNSTTVTAPANGSDISQTGANVENQWTKSVPTYVTNGEYWTCIQTHLDGSPTWVYGSPVLNQSLTDMNHDIDVIKSVTQHCAEDAQGAMSQAAATQVAQEALASKLKRIWINEVTSGNYLAGTYAASGISGVTFSESNPSSYGFNSLLRHNYLSFRYNTYKLVTIGTGVAVDSDSAISGVAINVPILTNNVISGIAKGMELSSGALKFYHAPTISGSTVTDGSLAMELTGSILKFYGSSTSTADATLSSTGLTLSKGGIKVIPSGGAIGDNNSVYISSDNLGSKVASLVNDNNKTNWRAVIGSKFGVDSEGNLYANNAHINGAIKATSLSTGTKTSYSTGRGTYIDDNGNIYVGNGSTNNFTVTSTGELTATNATLQGLKIYDDQYNLRANYSDSVILYGGDSISGADPRLEVTASGLNLYNANGIKISSFGSSVYVGSENNKHAVVSPDGFDYIAFDESFTPRSIFSTLATKVYYGQSDEYHYITTGTVGINNSSNIVEDEFGNGEIRKIDYTFDFLTNTTINIVAYRYYESNSQLYRSPALIDITLNDVTSDDLAESASMPTNKIEVDSNEYTNAIMLMRPIPFAIITDNEDKVHLCFAINGCLGANGGSIEWALYVPTTYSTDFIYYPSTERTVTISSATVQSSNCISFNNGSQIKYYSRSSINLYSWDPNTTIGTRRTSDEGTGFTTTIGRELTNSISNCLVIGKYNVNPITNDLFVIGNGTSSTPKNCFKINAQGAGILGFGTLNTTLQSSSYGTLVVGYTANASSLIKATNSGALARGYAAGGTIQATNYGSVATGNVSTSGTITASGQGSFAGGYPYYGTIQATGYGSFAYGRTYGNSTRSGSINSTGYGSIAIGYADAGGVITASERGSFAGGNSHYGTIQATGYGSFAYGYANTVNISAHGDGAIALNKGTIAVCDYQTVIGVFNAGDSTSNSTRQIDAVDVADNYGAYAFIIGNGKDEDNRSNALTVDWNGNVTANDYYSKITTLNLGTYVASGFLSSSCGAIGFSIPTGRVFPDGTTISKITFTMTARVSRGTAAANHGIYCITSSTDGSAGTINYDSTASTRFYNASGVQKTLTKSITTIGLHGGTNIYIYWNGDNYLFGANSLYINNKPVVLTLTSINVTFNIPTA